MKQWAIVWYRRSNDRFIKGERPLQDIGNSSWYDNKRGCIKALQMFGPGRFGAVRFKGDTVGPPAKADRAVELQVFDYTQE